MSTNVFMKNRTKETRPVEKTVYLILCDSFHKMYDFSYGRLPKFVLFPHFFGEIRCFFHFFFLSTLRSIDNIDFFFATDCPNPHIFFCDQLAKFSICFLDFLRKFATFTLDFFSKFVSFFPNRLTEFAIFYVTDYWKFRLFSSDQLMKIATSF